MIGFQTSPRRFHNTGNTCWLNSLLQCLLNVDKSVKFLSDTSDTSGELLSLLNKLKFETTSEEIDDDSISVCLENIGQYLHPYFIRGEQHDSQEVFLYIIDELIKYKDAVGESRTGIYSMFHCQFSFKTTDNETRYEPILSHSLYFENNFKESFENSFLNKQLTIVSPILTIHIINSKEIETSIEKMDSFKILESFHVSFSKDVAGALKDVAGTLKDDPGSSKEKLYVFNSCVFHMGGSSGGGHYISVVKLCDEYFMCDDTNVIKLINNDIFDKYVPVMLFYTSS